MFMYTDKEFKAHCDIEQIAACSPNELVAWRSWVAAHKSMITAEVEGLMAFYDAKTIADLIEQQADHVKLLQLRLSPYLNEQHATSKVREG